MAARTVASLLKTSLGPKGMDKMLVSPDGEVIITNDGATILEKMEVSKFKSQLKIKISYFHSNDKRTSMFSNFHLKRNDCLLMKIVIITNQF